MQYRNIKDTCDSPFQVTLLFMNTGFNDGLFEYLYTGSIYRVLGFVLEKSNMIQHLVLVFRFSNFAAVIMNSYYYAKNTYIVV